MILPKTAVEPTIKNPQSLLLYGLPLTGKTTFASQLPEPYLILDLDGTASFMKCCSVRITSFQELVDAMMEIKKQNFPYKYVVIDSLSTLEDYISLTVTKQYNASVSMDKRVNNIIDVPYKGYTILYQKFMAFCFGSEPDEYCLTKLAPHVIFIGHTKDKWIEETTSILNVEKKEAEKKSLNTEDTAKVLDLTGKLSAMFLRKIHAVGLMKKNGEIDFNGTDDSYGARCQHLNGKTIKRDWSLIYV